MRPTRRELVVGTGALAAGTLLGCRTSPSSSSPAVVSTSDRTVARTLAGMPTSDGAGVKLLRVIGQPALRNLDPFIMLDRIHSNEPNAYIKGFPDHPHRGFETVSVMLDGNMRHKDSRGNHGLITGGGAQWMTAGRGIVHSEMPEQEAGLLSGFQLWVNLPAKEKMCPQFYQDLQPSQIAAAALSGGGAVRVISGHANGLVGPVRDRPTAPTLLTLALGDDAAFDLDTPMDHTAFAFVHSGSAWVGPESNATRITGGTLAVLSRGTRVRIRAREEKAGILVAVGKPIGEPIVQYGPFVMNTEAEIQKAFEDYRAGILDKA